ncbi:ATPase family associated with various cellular activities (AAA)/AAA+ lid domain/Vps4 C terminal oligomerisation domain containing protein, putative [Angomonas deanei]|uniref:ATPase family associated with various cellular activities (AAA)/AAA+ lid domain/Vps4 C terminal oligomerisation domain containing protein, putative n=1 Tax=Angomonas deanei TaxID=59799 RepID=A0A7G2CSF2_9TRYP|nr:ATPase family associated with various cellular activities (AAA)/AAA+ lid domain/Vps4 C terminal oligomerisation domain containing protein, putative [Angomonas deanei]
MDGVGTDRGERVLLIGATNRPDELDEAARRRMEKRLYIPLPDFNGRRFLIHRLLQLLEASTGEASGEEVAQTQRRVHHLTEEELDQLAAKTEGYSGADLKLLCKDAAMGPLRELGKGSLSVVKASDLRPIVMKDFLKALRRLKPSVGQSEVIRYEDWNKQFGSFSALDGEDEDEEEDEKE